MDAIQLLQKDHREFEELFRRFERAARDEDRGAQVATARELVRALSVHSAIEEQFVYPIVRRSDEEGVVDALEEHHAAKVLLAEIDALDGASERFAAKVHVLASNVRQHVEEEERELLPQLARVLEADRLRALGTTLEEAKRLAPTRPHPAAPDTPPGVFVAGAIAAVVDRLRDAIRGAAELLRSMAERGLTISLDGLRGFGARAQERGRDVVEEVAERSRRTAEELSERGRRTAEDLATRSRRAADEVSERGRRAGAEARRRTRATANVVEREAPAIAGRITTASQEAARAARTGRTTKRARASTKRGRKGAARRGR